MKKTTWQIKDIIDLIYFLRQDEKPEEQIDQVSLSRRDRTIYMNHIRALESKGHHLRPGQSIRIWLKHRRKIESSAGQETVILPGKLFNEIYRFLTYGFLIFGLISGSGLAFSFLYYKGAEPINVSAFLGIFVMLQILLLLLFIMLSFMRRLSHTAPYTPIIAASLSALLAKFIAKAKERGASKLSASTRARFEAAYGVFQKERKTSGSLFFWPIFLLTQGFMAVFNAGVVCALLLKVIGSDIAFGWQSTLRISTPMVYDMVRVIAAPWSWIIPREIAYPTLSQIQGSHMILKEGIHHMATENMTAWWPFLCLTVLVYCLLPRLILLAAGLFCQKNALNRIDFTQSRFESLLRRMYTPIVNMAGQPVGEIIPSEHDPGFLSTPPSRPSRFEENAGYVLLIPDDIMRSHPQDDLLTFVSTRTGIPMQKHLIIGVDAEQDQRVLNEIAQKGKSDHPPNIFLIQEAWQPPIREDLGFITQLRQSLTPVSKIKIGLLGKPRQGKLSTMIHEAEWKVWDQKLKALGDPVLSLERLV